MGKETDRLLQVMAKLRDPQTGCPWDIKQTFASIAPHTIEEAYEVADAIANGGPDDLREELGDLLLQVVFHARMAEEQKLFSYEDVVETLVDKLVRRHPHVFGENAAEERRRAVASGEDVPPQWEGAKKQERASKGHGGALDGVARALPALMRAEKLSKRAARAGFDWPSIDGVFAKLAEETAELQLEIMQNAEQQRLQDELGDMLFCMVNLARFLRLDPEQALARANDKFMRRFQKMEQLIDKKGKNIQNIKAEEMEEYWRQAKNALSSQDG